MIFNSLRINNYRAYYGESIFDFPIEGERNISILYADNDVGKSCFFSAILFCLYGPKDSDDLKDLINVNAQSEKSYHTEVSLFIENGQDKIEISRAIDLRGKLDATPSSKDFKCTLELIKNGVPLSSDEDEKADFINSLVHEDASQYFFFDGEKINDYSTASGSQYKDAIARVLGIKEIDNAVEDLHLLKKSLRKFGMLGFIPKISIKIFCSKRKKRTRKLLSRKPCWSSMSEKSMLLTNRFKRMKIN